LIDTHVAFAVVRRAVDAVAAHGHVPTVTHSDVGRNVGAHDPELCERSRLLVAGQGLTASREDRHDPGTVESGGSVVHDDGREEKLLSDALTKGGGEVRVH
jgi:hypothetical protein